MKLNNIEAFYPLSFMQQGMLFHTLYAPEQGVYVAQTCCRLRGELNVPALERAWQEVSDRHPSLRTAFLWEGLKEPVQAVHQKVQLSVEQQDWRGLTAGEQEGRLKAYVGERQRRGMELSKPPLMRLALMRTGEDAYWFVWSRHHMLLDGWSGAILLREVFAFYEAFSRGRELPLERGRPYRDYILWLKQQDMAQAEGFWRRTLKGFTAPTRLNIGAQRDAAARPEEDYPSCETRLSTAATAALSAMAREHQLTFNTIVQGAWALLLSHYSGRPDVLFGATVSGRPPDLPGIESMVGLFINTLPVRARVEPASTLVEWLKELQSRQIEARQYDYSPLVQIQGWSEVPRGSLLFETLLVFENYPLEEATQGQGLTLEVSDFRIFEQTNYPLTLGITAGAELTLNMLYDARRFGEDAVRRVLAHLEALLEGFARGGGQRLDALSPLTDAERRLLAEWNQTAAPFPDHQCVHELFEEWAARTPDRVALTHESSQITYAELNARANRLAHYLRSLGIGAESRVGLFLERSPEAVVSLLAILKAGGAYVPLDPSYPRARLSFMLDDTGVRVILSRESLAGRLPETNARVVTVDAEREAIGRQPAEDLPATSSPDNLAYVIYTSGSTGRPKGVSVTHRAVVRLVRGADYVDLTPDECVLQFAPIAFDASTFELWGALLNGARLAVMTAAQPSLEELGRAIREYKVTTMWLTAGLFHLMVDHRLEDLIGVRQLLAGGDVLSPPHVSRFLRAASGSRLVNGYGPTENTTFTCCHTMTDDSGLGASVPIGRPISNTRAYILGAQMSPVPVGAVGELYAAGEGLARGYLNRAELTAERFVPDPFSEEPGGRLYRTGDLARWRPDGVVEFIGRRDTQVKVRGFRVELGEIEAALSACEGVRDCVVVVRQDADAEGRLVAYVVGEKVSGPAAEWRAALRRTLPEYMVPSDFVALEEMPLMPNGKLDRSALPAPGESGAEEGYVAPRNRTEELLAGIWSEVLRVEKVGVNSSFFDLGGHSLLAMRVATRVSEVFNVKVPLSELFVSTDIARLAELIDRLLAQPGAGDVKPAPTIRRRNRDAQQQFAELDKLSERDAKERVRARLQTN